MSLNILDRKIPEAIKYASNIITETSDFIPYCKSVYMMLVNSPEFSNIVFNYENLKKITSQVNIESEYNAFISKQQEKRKHPIKYIL